MDNLPLDLEYLTVIYAPSYVNYYNSPTLELNNLPTGLIKLYISASCFIKNSKQGLNTQIISYNYYDYSYYSDYMYYYKKGYAYHYNNIQLKYDE